MEWATIINTLATASIPASLGFAGVWLVERGKRDEKRESREATLEQRMDDLEKKLDRVKANFREEQRFSHRMILVMYSVISYVRSAADYRERHRDALPEPIPDLPDIEEIESLLAQRPTYDD